MRGRAVIQRLVMSLVRRRILRLAAAVEHEHPGPYPTGSVGAAYLTFAEQLRALVSA